MEKITWFFKWFVMNKKERRFWWTMKTLKEKYDYACFINNRNLTFNEFLTYYNKEIKRLTSNKNDK